MNQLERTAVLSLALIMCLRMLGLFMILPLFSLYATHLIGSTPTLIGIAVGIYGLTQGLFQIPFGMLSDHLGRKKIITVGIFIFILGSIIAALSHSIWTMIIGRALQGAGAVGSTIMALVADFTRENQRTKAMALIGITFGVSFALAMILGPVFANWWQINSIFWLAALLGIVSILVLFTLVPKPQPAVFHAESEPDLHQFPALLKNAQLLRLNFGIFALHIILTANFVVLPISLQNLAGLPHTEQWLLYLPVLILSFLTSVIFIVLAEKKHLLKEFFLMAIALIAVAELFLWFFAKNLWISAVGLLLFFTAFSLLEAFLPSLVSRTAPPKRKGTALGIYSSSQFLGIFIGGLLGGFIYGHKGVIEVYLFCVLLSIVWLGIAFKMKKPQYH